ncbi:thioesterase II family protein [Streptomyces prasinus]|uniref:thioesterase II family protein n=1 Tax=Streptomyces prasinus TaxID=67345 RepID=UPI0006EBB605|nr:alpha/beta fold hydrolase [Streptomyces prasinus]
MTIHDTASTWVRAYAPAPAAAIRLVCLPHAGGSASFWLPVAKALSPRVDVVAIQYPGRQDRRHEPCVDNLPELALRVHEVLGELDDRPTALLGHSMGATVAFEVARLMEARRPAAHLFVSGRRAPSAKRNETVHQRDDDGLLAEVRALAGTDSRLLQDEEIMRMALPAVRNDYRAAETYEWTPGEPLSCPVTALIGDDDPKAHVPEVEAWARHTTGPFALEVLPGGHFFLVDQSARVLDVIRTALAQS